MARRKADRVLAGGKTPKVRAERAHEWTAAKKARFLVHLAESCNVAASCAEVGMNTGSLYGLRKRSAAFRTAWGEALREGYAKLELTLLDRAINGTVKTVEKDGVINRTTDYSDQIALQLLKMHRDSVAAVDAEHVPEDVEAVRRRIGRKLDALRKRLEAAGETEESVGAR